VPELWQHQREGVAWLQDHPRAILIDEPGLGKSAQLALAAIEPVLVVAPAMVLDSGTWDDELAKFWPGCDATQVAYSSLTQREKTANGGSRPTGRLKPEYDRRWGTVIADEAHYLKGRKTTWTQAFKHLRAGRLYQATGTPLPNWAHEAFVPLQLAYPEKAGPGGEFGAYWRWAREWFDVAPTRWSPMAVGDLRADRTWEEFQRENWGDRILGRLRDDVLDLPPLTVTPFRVKMGATQKRVYNQLRRDFIAWLDSGTEVVAWNNAAQLIKLLKAGTGLEVLEEGAGHSAKLDAVADILRDRPRPTLVVAHFRDTVAACARIAESVGAEARILDGGTTKARRRDNVRAFQSGALPVLVATIDTVSEGMTLVSADQIIRVERSYRPSRNEQVIRRIHRIGQTRPCQVIDLVTEGTMDDRVLRILKAKTDQQMKAIPRAELRSLA
jgi:SNF2 family DNA or RNA helicase